MDKIRLIVAHEVPIVRLGLSCLLSNEPDIELIALTRDSKGLLDIISREAPELLIIGSRMPEFTGCEIAQQVKMRFPNVKIIVLNRETLIDVPKTVSEIGVEACIDIRTDYEELLNTIRQVIQDGPVSPLQNHNLPQIPASKDIMKRRLGQRELQVFCLAACGLSNENIAALMKISRNTVGVHLNKAYEKLDIHSRSQAVVYALRNNMLRLNGYSDERSAS